MKTAVKTVGIIFCIIIGILGILAIAFGGICLGIVLHNKELLDSILIDMQATDPTKSLTDVKTFVQTIGTYSITMSIFYFIGTVCSAFTAARVKKKPIYRSMVVDIILGVIEILAMAIPVGILTIIETTQSHKNIQPEPTNGGYLS